MSHNNAKIRDKSCQKYIFGLSKIIVSMHRNVKCKGLQRYNQKTSENTVPLGRAFKIASADSQQIMINCEKV